MDAPESFTDGTWNLRTDVWMFGVLLWEIFSHGKLPWTGLQDKDVIRNIQLRAKLEQPAECPNEIYYDILLSCWRLDPFARITGEDIERLVQQYIVDNDSMIQSHDLIWPAKVETDTIQENVDNTENGAALISIAHLEIDPANLTIGALLGHGAFGEVHAGILNINDVSTEVAVKTIKGQCSLEERRKFIEEARLFVLLQHENIVKCVGVHLESEPLWIVLELMQCDLKSYFKKSITISLPQLINVTLQVATAMEYLSSKKIIHRDLAARNVLVGINGLGSVKLNDFGLSRTLTTSNYYKKTSNDKIPVKWMAPESVFERVYSTKSDVWSFGVLCWEVSEDSQ